jgi:hypothetical protein
VVQLFRIRHPKRPRGTEERVGEPPARSCAHLDASGHRERAPADRDQLLSHGSHLQSGRPQYGAIGPSAASRAIRSATFTRTVPTRARRRSGRAFRRCPYCELLYSRQEPARILLPSRAHAVPVRSGDRLSSGVRLVTVRNCLCESMSAIDEVSDINPLI